MNIRDFVSNFRTYPVLFVGTGMSLRYFTQSYSWPNLLRKVIVDLTGDDEMYLNIDSRYNSECPKVAEEIERLFNTSLENDRHGKFERINDLFFENKRNGIDVSRFKLYLAEILRGESIRPEMEDEIKALTKIRKNISSIITTNYDNLIEKIFNFSPLVGNDILLSNPYGSVYKIHGSLEKPESLIITNKDYKAFNSKYELIRAQLLSLFVHNPIIFMGYSLQDENIIKILKTIFAYVDVNSDIAEKVRNNFLVVEWQKDSTNEEVIEYDVVIDGMKIKVNKIKTDNFLAIYDALSELNLPISAMDIRKVQNIVGEIYKGTQGIKVNITEDLDALNNGDKVLVLGSKKTIQYQFQTAKQLISSYFDVIEEANIQRILLIDKYQINSSQFFPIYGFSSLTDKISNARTLKYNQCSKIRSLRSKLISNPRIQNKHTTISDIINDATIPASYKDNAIIYAVMIGKSLPIEELETYLKNSSISATTGYNKLLVVYDYLKYSNKKPKG